jgi:hypothetical protein
VLEADARAISKFHVPPQFNGLKAVSFLPCKSEARDMVRRAKAGAPR